MWVAWEEVVQTKLAESKKLLDEIKGRGGGVEEGGASETRRAPEAVVD